MKLRYYSLLIMLLVAAVSYGADDSKDEDDFYTPDLIFPRTTLQKNEKRPYPLYVHDVIRNLWQRRIKSSSWYQEFVSEPRKVIELCTHASSICIDISEKYIQAQRGNYQDRYFTLEGKEVALDSFEPVSTRNLSEGEMDAYLSAPTEDNIWVGYHSHKNNAFIGMKSGGTAVVCHYGIDQDFHEYLEGRAPLAQVLLFEAVRQADINGEKITLSSYEQEVFNGISPKFKRAKEFLKESLQ